LWPYASRGKEEFERGYSDTTGRNCQTWDTERFFVRHKGDHLIFHHENATRAVGIPKYDSIPVTIIRNNMKTVGMIRVDYFSILRSI